MNSSRIRPATGYAGLTESFSLHHMTPLRKLSEGILNPASLATMLRKQFGKDSPVMSPSKSTQPNILRHIVIEAVTPTVDCARYPAKRIAGESCVVEADIFGDGPAALAAVIKWRRARDASLVAAPMALSDSDRWRDEFRLAEYTRYVFAIEAWTRAFTSWREYFTKKATAGLDAASDLAEGIALLENIRQRACADDRKVIADDLARLRTLKIPRLAVTIVSAPQLAAA